MSRLLTFTGGTFLGGGEIESVHLRVVPEPTSVLLLAVSLIVLAKAGRASRHVVERSI